MNIIERVARAMFEQDTVLGEWEMLYPRTKAPWLDRARAAIEAMREPTTEMKFVGIQEEMYGIDATWKGMIDAALKEE